VGQGTVTTKFKCSTKYTIYYEKVFYLMLLAVSHRGGIFARIRQEMPLFMDLSALIFQNCFATSALFRNFAG